MPTSYSFNEEQSGTFTGVLLDNLGSPMGSADISTFTITITDLNTREVINGRFKQNALNANDITLDTQGNVTWNIQPEDNIIVNESSSPGTIERHEVLLEWTWGTSKYSSEIYYFDVTQTSEIGDVGGTIYGTILDASSYFSTRLNSTAWLDATNSDRIAALTEATRLIDNLNFKGEKADSDQYLEFPRDDDTLVPTNVKFAAYELAWKLLDGSDPDYEMEMLRSESEQYGGVRETYQRGVFPEWIAAGIVSARAWQLLKPYLRDPRILTISRES
jgi:hypothetical protein